MKGQVAHISCVCCTQRHNSTAFVIDNLEDKNTTLLLSAPDNHLATRLMRKLTLQEAGLASCAEAWPCTS